MRGEGMRGEKAYTGRGHTRGEGIPTPRGEGLLLMKTDLPALTMPLALRP